MKGISLHRHNSVHRNFSYLLTCYYTLVRLKLKEVSALRAKNKKMREITDKGKIFGIYPDKRKLSSLLSLLRTSLHFI